MQVKKVIIENFKCFNGKFTLELNDGVNILVGNNEAGKSTILEAINLALSGLLNGRYLKNELSQYLFNKEVEQKYLKHVKTENKQPLPYILIEIYFDDNAYPLFIGNGNSERTQACGLYFKVEFDENYQDAYESLIVSPDEVVTIPIEYYKITWRSFDRDGIISRVIPINSIIIDASNTRYQNGSDVYISRIVRNNLEEDEKVNISQAHRKSKEFFGNEQSVRDINDKINEQAHITDKEVTIGVDMTTRNAWETSLTIYLDKIPFHQAGKGEQCIIKTNLALSNKKANKSDLILLEEPENHLSHTKLNEFVKTIKENCEEKQLIISTHSSYVANKLGLEQLILLRNHKTLRLSGISSSTQDFFSKLPGYETLRLLLCDASILVEGDSDELIVQRAYMDYNDGSLPIEDGIDVISVGLTFKRFLEIAVKLDIDVAVMTDNDGDFDKNITKKYADYNDNDLISIFADNRNELKTLEPQFVDANRHQLELLCEVIGIDNSKYNDADKVAKYMVNNKTKWALKVFESSKKLEYPNYIMRVLDWTDE